MEYEVYRKSDGTLSIRKIEHTIELTPEQKERRKAAQKKFYEKHREKRLADAKARYWKNREYILKQKADQRKAKKALLEMN